MATSTGKMIMIKDGRIRLSIKAVPGSSRSEIAGVKDDKLRVRIAAAPEDGKANAELIAFLAKSIGCPKSAIVLESGEKSRDKHISIPLSLEASLRELLSGQ